MSKPSTDVPKALQGAVNELDNLTDEQRREVFERYCVHCGSIDPKCYCSWEPDWH